MATQYDGLTLDSKASLWTGNDVYRDASGTLVRKMNRGSGVGDLWSAAGEYTPQPSGIPTDYSAKPEGATFHESGPAVRPNNSNLGLGGATNWGLAKGSSTSSGGGGVASSGTSNGMLSTIGQNPYLDQLKSSTANTMVDSFNRSVVPGIQQGAVAAGGYGGSRQGVIEANAMNDLGKNMGNAMASIDNGAYNSALNYDLGLRGNNLGYYNGQNSYDLGLRNNELGFGNLGLGYANLDLNVNNSNVANQLNGMNAGLGVFDRLMGNNGAGINAGNTINDTPANYFDRFNNTANGIGNGFGTTTGTQGGGNPLLGAAGGAQLGNQIGSWWGSGNSGWNSQPNRNVFMGNGSMGD